MISLDALRTLTWPARHIVRTGATGAHRSRVRGPAPEFSEYRAFRQGDDPRRLDWKLLARTNRAYLRLTEDRAALGTMLIVDASRSMDFPSGAGSKWQRAVDVAVALAQVAHQSGDPVGVVVPGIERASIPPRSRRLVVSEIAGLLGNVRSDITYSPLRAAGHLPLASRSVLISDFLDEEGVPPAITTLIGHGGECHAVRVVAADELDPPSRLFTALDPEQAALQRAFGPAARDEYLQRFTAWSGQVAARWRAAGIHWTDITTAEPVLASVRRIVRAGA